MLNCFERILALFVTAVLLFATTACTPAQEKNAQQIVKDIQDVVTLASPVLQVAQSFGALDTPQDRLDIEKAETYAGQVSQAGAASIAEWASADSYTAKVNKIAVLLLSVAPIGPVTNAKIAAAVALLAAAVNVLLNQLGVGPTLTASFRSHASAALGTPVAAAHFGLKGLIPGTTAYKLRKIQQQAIANAVLAKKLLAQ